MDLFVAMRKSWRVPRVDLGATDRPPGLALIFRSNYVSNLRRYLKGRRQVRKQLLAARKRGAGRIRISEQPRRHT
jgi:hypothetical protein